MAISDINQQIAQQNAGEVKDIADRKAQRMALALASGNQASQFNAAQDTEMGPVDVTKNINKGVTDTVQNSVNQGNMSQEDIAARSMEGVDKSGQLPNDQSGQQQAQGLGGDVDQGMMAAINNRQGKNFESHLNELQQQAKFGAKGKQAQQQMNAQAAVAQQEDLKTQMVNTQLVKYQNDVAQRNSVLNAVLGLVGGAVGAVVGGPAGAAAGSAISKGGSNGGQKQLPTE